VRDSKAGTHGAKRSPNRARFGREEGSRPRSATATTRAMTESTPKVLQYINIININNYGFF